MKKKMSAKEEKHLDVLGIVVGLSILFSVLTAVLGYEGLCICNAMVLAVFCVLTCMAKDLRELCNGLAEEEE